MFKKPVLCRFVICQRLILLVILWVTFLVAITDIRRASEAGNSAYEGIKRLAIYGMTLRANRE